MTGSPCLPAIVPSAYSVGARPGRTPSARHFGRQPTRLRHLMTGRCLPPEGARNLLLPQALGTATGPLPVIMPERLAKPPYQPFTPVRSLLQRPLSVQGRRTCPGRAHGSERFSGYRPRESGSPDWHSD